MNEISLNGKRICLKVSILFKTDNLAKMLAPHNTIWLSRTIPMSKYFSGSRPLRHNEVQLYLILQDCLLYQSILHFPRSVTIVFKLLALKITHKQKKIQWSLYVEKEKKKANCLTEKHCLKCSRLPDSVSFIRLSSILRRRFLISDIMHILS